MCAESLPIVSVSFRLGGSAFDPEAVTARLGVEPTLRYRAGDHISGGIGRRRSDGWIVRIGPREALEVGRMLDELQERLPLPSSVVAEACVEFGLVPWIYCAVEPTSRRTPSLVFSREVIAWVQEVGAFIDVDLLLWEAHAPQPAVRTG